MKVPKTIASRSLDCGFSIGLGLGTRTSACGRARCAAFLENSQLWLRPVVGDSSLSTTASENPCHSGHPANLLPSSSFAFSDLLLRALVFKFCFIFHCTKLYLPSHFLRDSFRVDCVLLDLSSKELFLLSCEM